MESRNNDQMDKNIPQRSQTMKIESQSQDTLGNKNSSRYSLFTMFKRSRTGSEANSEQGFINRQMPAYWHGK